MTGTDTIEPGEIATWLEANIDGFHGLQTVVKFASGQSNPTFLLGADSGKYVLRTKPQGALLKSAHLVDREFRVMQALAGSKVPVPKVFALCSDRDSPVWRMFYVMAHCEGRIFWDPALPDVASNSERTAIYDAMNATLAALHDVDVAAAGLGDYGKPGNYFERQLARWTSQYKTSQTDELPAMDALMAWLSANLPADDGQVSLVHGDYRLDNMIFAPDKPEILAVIDWELSTLGHPLADLAYQCMQWRLPHDTGFRGLGGLDRQALGIPAEQAYVDAYCARRGIAAISSWDFYVAFSFFRLAAILQGVYRRSLDGNASNPEKAKLYGQAVPLLAAMAMKTV